MVPSLWKTIWQFLKKLNIHVPCDPEMKVNSRQKMHTSVHSSRIHNSQNVATTQMSTDRGMDKQNVVDPYNGILLSNEKEQRIDKHTNVDGPQQHYTK